MPDLPLNIRKHLAGIGFIPPPVQLLGHDPKLDYEIARKVLRLDLPPPPPPVPKKGSFVIAHDDPGARAADEIAAIATFSVNSTILFHFGCPLFSGVPVILQSPDDQRS